MATEKKNQYAYGDVIVINNNPQEYFPVGTVLMVRLGGSHCHQWIYLIKVTTNRQGYQRWMDLGYHLMDKPDFHGFDYGIYVTQVEFPVLKTEVTEHWRGQAIKKLDELMPEILDTIATVEISNRGVAKNLRRTHCIPRHWMTSGV